MNKWKPMFYRDADDGAGGGSTTEENQEQQEQQEQIEPVKPAAEPVQAAPVLDPAFVAAVAREAAIAAVQSQVPAGPLIEGTNLVAPRDWDDMSEIQQQVYIAREEAKVENAKALQDLEGKFAKELRDRDLIESNRATIAAKADPSLRPYVDKVASKFKGALAGDLSPEGQETLLLIAEGMRAKENSGKITETPVGGQVIDGISQKTRTELEDIESYLPLMKGNKTLQQIARNSN